MLVHLKVKIKSLASEAQIIRREERRAKTSKHYRRAAKRLLRLGREHVKGSFTELTNFERELNTKKAMTPEPENYTKFWSLRDHRTGVLRGEARSAQLAYGYLRGKQYEQLETKPKKFGKRYYSPDFKRILEIVLKFADNKSEIPEQFENWKKNAQAYTTDIKA